MKESFSFYPGQFDYLARVGAKDCGLVAADVGTGKSLMAITLIRLKLDASLRQPQPGHGPPQITGRALIIAPQGTLRGDEDDESAGLTPSQWRQEIARFAPGAPVQEIFTLDDYRKLTGGQSPRWGKCFLPPGIYISYYEAMFRNKARETLPESWDHMKLCKTYGFSAGPTKLRYTGTLQNPFSTASKADTFEESEIEALAGEGGDRQPRPDRALAVGDQVFRVGSHYPWRIESLKHTPVHDYTEGVGEERDGIRGIAEPCLSTLIGHEFDFVGLDEAHICANLDAQVTQALIRLQPRYRWAFTATPIPNVISNLFSIMGWLCVGDWYLGERRNAAWPYARDEIATFNGTFMSSERDHTQEGINEERARRQHTRWSGRCEKPSPVISSPARLLKLIKPTMAYISKEACNPALVPCHLTDVRVPLGTQQARLYGHFLNRGNIPCGNALIRARKQLAYLRGICADPAGFEHGGPSVKSNFNPKTIAILELIAEILERREQVVVVCARIGQTNAIASRLREAGITYSRIDSTISAALHSRESNHFKSGASRVMLMGIKCARGFSFDDCPNEIVGSLEYSFGSLHQAKGRVWRVNSKRPINIYCVLHRATIEETMFDIVATKQDAATICLLGRRVPRDFKPVDMNEVLARSTIAFEATEQAGAGQAAALRSESDCERDWSKLLIRLQEAAGTIDLPERFSVVVPALVLPADQQAVGIKPTIPRAGKSARLAVDFDVPGPAQSIPVVAAMPFWKQRLGLRMGLRSTRVAA